jgi:hypothetical protein
MPRPTAPVQGFATGLATATLGATILDTDRSRGPVLNSITAFAGLTAGSLGAAVLVTVRALQTRWELSARCSWARTVGSSPVATSSWMAE